MKVKLVKIGNSLGVVLTRTMLALLDIDPKVGTKINVEIADKTLLVTKVEDKS